MKNFWFHVIMFVIALLTFLFSLQQAVRLARAHQAKSGMVYDLSCCGGSDCEQIPFLAVKETRDGWFVDYVSQKFGHIHTEVLREVYKPSKDGEFHACWTAQGKPRCFYVPGVA
jgi:hypothetical protein